MHIQIWSSRWPARAILSRGRPTPRDAHRWEGSGGHFAPFGASVRLTGRQVISEIMSWRLHLLIWSSRWPARAISSPGRPTPRDAHTWEPKMAILHRLNRRFGTALVLQGQVEGRISPLLFPPNPWSRFFAALPSMQQKPTCSTRLRQPGTRFVGGKLGKKWPFSAHRGQGGEKTRHALWGGS